MSDPDIAKLTAERIALEMFGKGIVPSDAHAHAAKLIVEAHLAPILARNAAMEAVLRECRAYVQEAVNEDEREYNLRPLDEGCRQNLEESSALLHGIDELTAKGAGQ